MRTILSKIMKQWNEAKNMYEPKNRHNITVKQKAIRTREKYALIYAFATWNIFGLVFYLMLKNRIPDDPAEKRKSIYSLTGSPGNIHVYQIKGFTVQNEFQMEKEEEYEEIKEVE